MKISALTGWGSIGILFSAITVSHFGFTFTALAALLLTGSLLLLAKIDLDSQLLPDEITLPLLWAGLLLNISDLFTSLSSAVLGAAIGYLFLWSLYWIFKWVMKKEGIGYGDFKLLAMLGAWLGWQALPEIALLASATGSLIGILYLGLKGYSREKPIPFGPFLAGAGWISLLWGDKIRMVYLHFTLP